MSCPFSCFISRQSFSTDTATGARIFLIQYTDINHLHAVTLCQTLLVHALTEVKNVIISVAVQQHQIVVRGG